MTELTHFNEQGHAKMVDITSKTDTVRTAIARSSIEVSEEIYQRIIRSEIEKGDVLAVAQVAGIMAAKRTPDLIPMCHPIQIKGVNLAFSWNQKGSYYELVIEGEVKTKGSTGVEMEALTAVSVCALTVYDMCKAVDKGMIIGPTYLMEKTGERVETSTVSRIDG